MASSRRRARGDGGVHQRADGRWEATPSLGVGPSGRRRRRTFSGATRAAAIARMREAEGAVARGDVVVSSTMTVEAWVTRWLETSVAAAVELGSLKARTGYSYRTLAHEYVIPILGERRLDQLGSADVDEMTTTMSRAGYSPNTIRLARALLRQAMNAAVDEGLIGRNPVTRSTAPALRRTRRQGLTLDQPRELLASLGGEAYGPLIETALWTGLRKGELLALTWDDIALDEAQLTVAGTLGRLTGLGLVTTTPKSGFTRRCLTVACRAGPRSLIPIGSTTRKSGTRSFSSNSKGRASPARRASGLLSRPSLAASESPSSSSPRTAPRCAATGSSTAPASVNGKLVISPSCASASPAGAGRSTRRASAAGPPPRPRSAPAGLSPRPRRPPMRSPGRPPRRPPE